MDNTPQADHLHFLFDAAASVATLAGQRRRLASTVEGLSTDELASPSRCAGWSVADVLRHLVWVDRIMRRIWSGDESVAEGFDPRTTPNAAVQDDRAVPDEDVRERYLASTDTMLTDLESSDPRRLGQPSLSPAGRVPWWMSVVHVGWDSSIHERDVLLPLGRGVERSDGETELCLAYSLALTSFFAGRDPLAVRVGTIELHRGDGPVIVQAVSEAGGNGPRSESPVLATDDPVGVIDAIAGRRSIEDSLTGDAAVIQRIGGLSRFFRSPPS